MQGLLGTAQQHAAAAQDLQRRQRAELAQALLACCAAGAADPERLGARAPCLLAMLSLGQGLLRAHLVAISAGAKGLVSSTGVCCDMA